MTKWHSKSYTNEIEQRLAPAEPQVELLECERVGSERLRLVIDHPDGVSLALCERVTGHLRDLLVDYGLEVSSPGPERPLTKPDHFKQFLGRRARVRLRTPREGHRSVTGELVGRVRRGGDGGGRRRRRVDPVLRDQQEQPSGGPMTKEIVEAVGVLEREKGISADKLMEALEDALLSAYKKTPGAAKYARVEVDRDTGDFLVFELILPPELEEQLLDEVEEELGEAQVDPETGELREPEAPEIDQERLAQYRDQIDERDVTPHDFGRIAAQTAKQVILQRIREAERDMMFHEYQDRVGELITGIVQQSDSRYTLVQLRERVEALLPRGEQVHGERYDHGQRVKAIITDVSNQSKGPSIIVSRRSPELIRALFELEVPEIADGLVEIQNVAREPGYRSKIAVVSHASGVDPVGACVGPRGSRVRMVVSELRGEKIDIIPFNEEPARFVAKALSPARVREVLVDDEGKQATVIVPDDQLSLAIGKDGLNARLAARLTGWRVDIRSETEFAEEEAEMGYDEEEVAGRCAAILANGKRCPNASLPGSRYCGLPAHQALTDQETDYVVPPEEGSNGDEPAEAERRSCRGGRRRGGRRRGSRCRGSRCRGARRGGGGAGGRGREEAERGGGASRSSGSASASPAAAPCPGTNCLDSFAGPAERCGRTRRAAPRVAAPTSAGTLAVPRRSRPAKPLARSFRAPTTVQPETIDLLKRWQRSAFTR